MAVTLILNSTQVYPDLTQTIDLSFENPYFTQSEAYTLDITFPMDILGNRVFFENMHRIDKTKKQKRMSCRMLRDNVPVFSGSARITQFTDLFVKIQLFAGKSEINFLSEDYGEYIDEMDIGKGYSFGAGQSTGGGHSYGNVQRYSTDNGVKIVPLQVYNETAAGVHLAYQYSLIDMMKLVFRHLGFEVTECSIDCEPWNLLFVATANATFNMSHVFPHWTPKVFVEELERFFNVKFLFDQFTRTIRIVDNQEYFDTVERIEIEPLDEYTVEMKKDVDSQALTGNINFDMSSSPAHDYDVIPDLVRELAKKVTFGSEAEAREAYMNASETDKKGKIYAYPGGMATGWLHEVLSGGQIDEELRWTAIDMLGPLTRDKDSDKYVSLKICPVAIDKSIVVSSVTGGSGVTHTSTYARRIASLECTAGSDIRMRMGIGLWNNSSSNSSSMQDNSEASGSTHHKTRTTSSTDLDTSDGATIQEYIEGSADIEKKEKEDRLQVMFIDGIPNPWADGQIKYEDVGTLSPFTDYEYKPKYSGNLPKWSLSLNRNGDANCLGSLHNNNFTFNLRNKYCVKFLADEIPNQKAVFMIHGKCYGCEKLTVKINGGRMEKLMTGYFYEMTL